MMLGEVVFAILAFFAGLVIVGIYLVWSGLFMIGLQRFYERIGIFYAALITVFVSVTALLIGYKLACFDGLIIALILFVVPVTGIYLLAQAPSKVI
ncbi:MAG: hypothetical protein PHY30_03345, partial [Candidatus Pacebacteria bacterium]|nr:hypothetical protein [Candidatus Paceibacterota bacterium]